MAPLLPLLLACGGVVLEQEGGAWEPRAPLLEPLQELSVVLLDGEMVVVGGIAPGEPANSRVEAYDPGDDVWRSRPDLPVGRHHVNAAVVDERLYVLGGLDGSFSAHGDAWVLEGGSWTSVEPLAAGRERGSAAVGVLDGRIHLVGGVAGTDLAVHDVYDPTTDAWSILDDAPVARDHGGGVVIAGVLYVVGGRHRAIDDHLTDLWGFDGERWTQHADLPTSRGGLAAAALDGRLHVIGGEGASAQSGVFDTHEVWDPRTDTWTAAPTPTVPRHGTGALGLDGVLYLPGGADIQAIAPIDDHEAFRPDGTPTATP